MPEGGIVDTAESVDRDRVLASKSFCAYLQARYRLSDEGQEVLALITDAEHCIDTSTGEAFMESGALDGLPKDDQMIILMYIAQERLLEELEDAEG
jgi:hypothetical protein